MPGVNHPGIATFGNTVTINLVKATFKLNRTET